MIHLIWVLPLLFGTACKKETPVPVSPAPPLKNPVALVEIGYFSDAGPYISDNTLRYQQAGIPYSITKFTYYLSSVTLHGNNATSAELRGWLYGDAAHGPERFTVQRPAAGTYTSISFNIGLDSIYNGSFFLPPTDENLNMQWPEPMGGGYHFLMLEGHYTDGTGQHGYALHLGRNHSLRSVTLPATIVCEPAKDLVIRIRVNVNEWLYTPHFFDFTKNTAYIMGNDTLMDVIADNGVDAFSLSP